MKTQRNKTVFVIVLLNCIVACTQMLAHPISWQQAQDNALAFMLQRGKSVGMPSLRHVPMTVTSACYVFNIGDNDGYIIASADDCAPAILGYSDTGSVDVESMPGNMRVWLEEYARQIRFVSNRSLSVSHVPVKSPSQPAIAPMLTCRWKQNAPFNNYCPTDSLGRRCVTGCVATAMAQVMYYHRYHSVTHTTHEIPAYVTETGVSVDAVPAGSFIDWDNLVDSYYASSEPTEQQQDAVANLMRYCGAAVQMNYTYSESAAYSTNAATALVAYFNYSSKTKRLSRDDSGLSDEEWENLIYHELSQSRPVLYCGATASYEAHEFVVDGYDGEGFFHMNWGWGSPGGYYRLTAVDSLGTSLLRYSFYQDAIINAEPRAIEPQAGAGFRFEDAFTRALCLQAGDENDDGVLDMDEILAVKSMGPYLVSLLYSFDEFQYFTGVTSICDQMFDGCGNLASIVLHDSLTSIGSYAFKQCHSLKEITVPSSVTSIGNQMFNGCTSLKQMTWNVRACPPTVQPVVPSAVEKLIIGDEVDVIINNFAKNAKIKELKIGKSVTKINSFAFYQCTRLKTVVIPDAVTSINQWAFYGDTGLEMLVLGNGLTTIGNQAFNKCSSLRKVSIPNSVTKIGMYAFSDCTELGSVLIGSSVTSISSNAFNGCDSLKMVTCLVPEPISINSNVFKDLYGNAVLRVPAQSLEAYQAAAPWNQFSRVVAIDPGEGDVNLDGVTNIEDMTCLIDQILSGTSTEYSDVNGDGLVSIADVADMLDKLLCGKEK